MSPEREADGPVKFIHSDCGHMNRGDVVEIVLSGSAANVRLLDDMNFNRYRNGQQHQYKGGLARQSPARLVVPNAGRWHAVVDMQGLVWHNACFVSPYPDRAPTTAPPAATGFLFD